MSATPAPKGAREAAADVAALREQQPLDLLMRTFTARVNSVIAEPPRAVGTPRAGRRSVASAAAETAQGREGGAATATPGPRTRPRPTPAPTPGARGRQEAVGAPAAAAQSPNIVNARSSPTVAMLDDRGLTVAPDTESPVFSRGAERRGEHAYARRTATSARNYPHRPPRHAQGTSPPTPAAGMTLQSRFADRRNVVHRALSEPFGKESGIAPLGSTRPSGAHHTDFTSSQGAAAGAGGSSSHVAVSTADAATSAPGKHTRENRSKRAGAGVVQAAGGVALLCIMPAAVFVAVLAVLYGAGPSFARKKPRDEIEVASLDHARIIAIAGASALLTALASIIWGSVAVSRQRSASKT